MQIKICGITRLEDGLGATELGADALGLNFFPQSKRFVDETTARAILAELPSSTEPVGVYVNQSLTEATRSAQRLGLIDVQLHADVHEQATHPTCRFIQAFQIGDRDDLTRVAAFLEECRQANRLPRAILIDSRVAGQYGGTGHTAPWNLLADFAFPVPLLLAGGLTPENVAEAIRIVRPNAVDVASGVESSPGRKDVDKMRRFIAQAREAGQRYPGWRGGNW